ncbi:hypothetical protein [Nocardia pseudobrasiliensis]|uniref:hypothetical protein n=1 Tax=Nocardia pseudobrasiliensis TaxID=45979 RepID=UPI000834736A|nr:hypothetical protein [Nocardia pseudobrasiliensis]
MIRKALVVSGVFAAAAVSAAAPAQAGPFRIDGRTYASAPGCVTVRTFPQRLDITNDTTLRARVYLLPGCRGGVTRLVPAGHRAHPFGASVLLD